MKRGVLTQIAKKSSDSLCLDWKRVLGVREMGRWRKNSGKPENEEKKKIGREQWVLSWRIESSAGF